MNILTTKFDALHADIQKAYQTDDFDLETCLTLTISLLHAEAVLQQAKEIGELRQQLRNGTINISSG